MSTQDRQVKTEERCERSDLYPSQCWHCRSSGQPRFIEAVFDVPGAKEDDPFTTAGEIVASFAAMYSGHCAACDETFEAGAWISRTRDGDYLCAGCA